VPLQRALLLIGLLIPGCGDEGRLLITLERPKIKSFDPMNDVRLSRFNVRVSQGSEQLEEEAVRTERTELEVGSVPVGDTFDLRLAGKSGTGQMVGLGLVFDLNISGDRETPVVVKFRKPIGFVAGNHGIEQLDTTASSDSTIRNEPAIAAPNAADVAASSDGAWIVVVSGTQLQAFLTYDSKRWANVTLPAPATCVSVSPDSRYTVICHENGTVSVVDMSRLAQNQLELRPVAVGGKPTRVVFGSKRRSAQVLVDGASYTTGCGVKSRMVEVDVGSAVKGREVALNRPVADLAVDPRDGRVLLALACEGKLGRINGDQVEIATQTPGGVYDIALTDQYIVLFGTRAAGGVALKGEALLIDLNKQGFSTQSKPFFLPGLTFWFATPAGEGAVGWAPETQDFSIYDIAVAPDGQRALALFRASYSSNTFYNSCSYNAKMTAYGLMLVDLTVDRVVHTRFANLEIANCSICGQDRSKDVRDALSASGALASPLYTPKGVAMLFGGP
jgi:hypothetical protein